MMVYSILTLKLNWRSWTLGKLNNITPKLINLIKLSTLNFSGQHHNNLLSSKSNIDHHGWLNTITNIRWPVLKTTLKILESCPSFAKMPNFELLNGWTALQTPRKLETSILTFILFVSKLVDFDGHI